ncbi:AP2/ERF domain-containing protein [Cynara cardunculus var. scolymus]|uniref:AP2/ERF domain-containing protein n=1 Tax=Cynara cardunculus var. scolymus TaxID=59895 RepID=A0A103YJ99_CYNCS|nr:AP2/ERF domain-containing protein [Cynara cardunculus var. scolymus]
MMTRHHPRHTTGSNSFFDEEIKLASRNPKKRAGRKKFKETRHPVYRGVRRRDSGKWVCEVRQPNKKTSLWLGTYPTADMAARAHDVAVLAMKGRSACLNFADSLWRLPIPESSSVKDIQRAAVEGAEAFRPVESDVAEVEESKELAGNVFYMDEEAIFGMPEFFAYMAEGLMLPPPITVGYDNCEDNVEFSIDASLWTF